VSARAKTITGQIGIPLTALDANDKARINHRLASLFPGITVDNGDRAQHLSGRSPDTKKGGQW
jgi:hypothetical protein